MCIVHTYSHILHTNPIFECKIYIAFSNFWLFFAQCCSAVLSSMLKCDIFIKNFSSSGWCLKMLVALWNCTFLYLMYCLFIIQWYIVYMLKHYLIICHLAQLQQEKLAFFASVTFFQAAISGIIFVCSMTIQI